MGGSTPLQPLGELRLAPHPQRRDGARVDRHIPPLVVLRGRVFPLGADLGHRLLHVHDRSTVRQPRFTPSASRRVTGWHSCFRTHPAVRECAVVGLPNLCVAKRHAPSWLRRRARRSTATGSSASSSRGVASSSPRTIIPDPGLSSRSFPKAPPGRYSSGYCVTSGRVGTRPRLPCRCRLQRTSDHRPCRLTCCPGWPTWALFRAIRPSGPSGGTAPPGRPRLPRAGPPWWCRRTRTTIA